jgi:hypothetical protein
MPNFAGLTCIMNYVYNNQPGPLTVSHRSFDKAEPNSLFRGKYIRNNLIRTRGSLICKLSWTPD